MYIEGSGETGCSNTNPNSEKNGEEEDESEVKNGSPKLKDGGSSSNSTVEEGGKKSSVRPYIRSKMPRLRWTPDLHLRFMNAVERLGGHDRATPKLVLQLMNIKGLNIAHVKSHLQMFRSKRIDGPNQGMMDHRIFMEGTDHNMFKLSQLPNLPSFNHQAQSPNFRFGDASWNNHERWMSNSSMVHSNSASTIMTRPGLYGTLVRERLLNNRYYNSSSTDLDHQRSTWRAKEDSRNELESLHKNQHWLGQSRQQPIELNSSKAEIDRKNSSPSLGQAIKRKASEFEIDLNLSLGIESGNDDEIQLQGKLKEEEENLLLSLYTSPSSTKASKKMKEYRFVSDMNARGASTLDLTL